MYLNLSFQESNENLLYELSEENKDQSLFYIKQADIMRQTDRKTMYIDWNHLCLFDTNYELRESISTEFYR